MKKLFFLCILWFSVDSFSQEKLEVFFDFNIDVPNEVSLVKIKEWVSNNKSSEITKVLGYCDSVDNNKYNKDLAMRRINSMIEIFKKNNIKIVEKAELKSFGEDFKYSKIQSENRKVEVFYTIPKDKKQSEKLHKKIVEKVSEAKKETETAKVIDTEEKKEISEFDYEAIIEEEKSALATKFEKAKKGDLVRINNINFYFNSEKVMDQSIPLMNELLQIMLDNPKLRIEIHGHICCNPNPNDTKLSYRRALVILKYLTGHGVEVGRLGFKGYGSNDPIYKLPEKNEKQRAANRRVEILITAK